MAGSTINTVSFSARIESIVREAILRRLEQMLPVGASLVVPTGHACVPWLVAAPTMEMPEAVPAQHCGRALRLVDQHPELDADIFCPGLATGTGRVAPEFAAEEMAAAYAVWLGRRRKT